MLWGRPDKKMPSVPLPDSDEIMARQQELAELNELASLFQAAGKAILEAASKMEAAPRRLVERLKTSSFASGKHAKVVHRLTDQLAQFTSALKEAEPLLSELQQLVRESESLGIQARQATEAHVQAWSMKVQSDQDVEDLTRDKRRTFALEEKRARLAAKDASNEAWEKSKLCGKHDLAAALDKQLATTASMVGKVQSYYGFAFQRTMLFKVRSLMSSLSCTPSAAPKDTSEYEAR